ncbi:MAG: hypothetical protein J6P60_01030 [Lachnospiraceae bacterium]|nr:hypothetical protein [Lachnospiraceae bacterium]
MMDRREFMDGLRRSLSGRVDPDVIDETVRYYEDYLDVQIKKGEDAETVLAQLGSPALIAKSIVSAKQSVTTSADASVVYDGEGDDAETQGRFSRSWIGDKGIRLIMGMPGWLTILIALVILLLVLGLVFSILSFLAPILGPLVIVLLVIHYFEKK